MQGFKLDSNGDVVIENGIVQMASGNDLLCDKVRQVLKTNNGEWWLNENEGIDFDCLLTKNPNYTQIEDNIKNGLLQVDNTFELISIDYTPDRTNRSLTIHIVARNAAGKEIELDI